MLNSLLLTLVHRGTVVLTNLLCAECEAYNEFAEYAKCADCSEDNGVAVKFVRLSRRDPATSCSMILSKLGCSSRWPCRPTGDPELRCRVDPGD